MQALYGRPSTAACLQQQRSLPRTVATAVTQPRLRQCNALPSSIHTSSSSSSTHGSKIGSSSASSTSSRRPQFVTRSQAQEQVELATKDGQLVGEDAASFDFSKQSLQSWGLFVALLSTVLGAMYLVRGPEGGGGREQGVIENSQENHTHLYREQRVSCC